ncbi:ankyrin repeat-containing domain protein, partial [Roridomyces roridus]
TLLIIHTGDDGNTPLHLALANGHADVAMLLIEKGADINVKDDDGSTPLHVALAKGHADVAKLLIERGANISLCTYDLCSPLRGSARYVTLAGLAATYFRYLL